MLMNSRFMIRSLCTRNDDNIIVSQMLGYTGLDIILASQGLGGSLVIYKSRLLAIKTSKIKKSKQLFTPKERRRRKNAICTWKKFNESNKIFSLLLFY